MLKLHGGNYLHPKELDKKTRTFMAILINDFGFTMIAILIPVFLWLEGYALIEIALFHIALFAFRAFTSAVAIKLAWHIGVAKALQIGFLSSLIAVGSMVAVTAIPDANYELLGLAALLNGVSAGLYWVPRHLSIEAITTKKDAGSVATRMRLLETVVITLGPLFGGYIAAQYGSEYALGVSFLVILISTFYVIADTETMKDIKVSHKDIHAGDVKYDMVANFARGFDLGIALVAWPLFIFIITGKVEHVGAIGTISGLAMIPLMYYIATRVDGREKEYLSSGVFVRVLIYPVRALAATFHHALGVNIAADIGDVQTGAAHMSHYYKRASQLNRIRYTYYMEILFPLGGAIAWILVAILSQYFNESLTLQLSFATAVLIIPFTAALNKIKANY